MLEAIIGLGLGTFIGVLLRFSKDGIVFNPKVNIGVETLKRLDERATITARQVTFDSPNDMRIRGE